MHYRTGEGTKVSLYLTTRTIRTLRAQAAARQVSLSALVDMALSEYLRRYDLGEDLALNAQVRRYEGEA